LKPRREGIERDRRKAFGESLNEAIEAGPTKHRQPLDITEPCVSTPV
jgi:hypothetical protein